MYLVFNIKTLYNIDMANSEMLGPVIDSHELGFVPEIEVPLIFQIDQGLDPEVLGDLGYKFSVNDIAQTLLRSEVKLKLGLDFLPQSQAEKTIAINSLEESFRRVESKPKEAARKIFTTSTGALSDAQLTVRKLEEIKYDISSYNIKEFPEIKYYVVRFLTLENIFINLTLENSRMPNGLIISQMVDNYIKNQLPLLNNRQLVENYQQALLDARNRFEFWFNELASVRNHPLVHLFRI